MLTNSRLAGSRRLPPIIKLATAFVAVLAILLSGTLAALVPFRSAYAQAGTCKSSANGSYTVNLCITEPANGATVTGVITVTTTASISGSSSGIAKLIFTLDGTYLITDYQAPYTFQLSTANFANGSHTLAVTATMRDGFITAAPTVTLNFSNAGAPPPGPNFVPVSPAPRPAGQSLIMAAVGDGAGGETNAGMVTQMIDGWNPDLVLYLGDVYEKGSFAEFYNWYGQANSFYGLFRDVTNPTIGNHEYENGAAPGYFSYWYNIPNYYSYNAGGWHFIALNSTSQFKQTATTSPQYQWLVNDLNANTAPCTVAYFHHPVLSVGPQGDTPSLNAIWSKMVQSGVDLVLTGHDHGYQRWVPLDANLNPSPNGATEFVSAPAAMPCKTLSAPTRALSSATATPSMPMARSTSSSTLRAPNTAISTPPARCSTRASSPARAPLPIRPRPSRPPIWPPPPRPAATCSSPGAPPGTRRASTPTVSTVTAF